MDNGTELMGNVMTAGLINLRVTRCRPVPVPAG